MTAARPACMTIAGSDSCGGAGIQADLKTFSAWRVESATVVTAVTAQNTLGVDAASAIDASLVGAQLRAVLADLPISAAKTGMLANAGIIDAIVDILDDHEQIRLVVDPVMVATSGARLLDRDAEQALVQRLLPRASLVTPNRPEAAVLAGMEADAPAEELARAILAHGCRAVLIKGGHDSGARIEDVLITERGERRFSHARVNRQVHGTGCALSAAIAAALARGSDLEDAVARAIEWLQGMIAANWQPAQGNLGMLPFGDRSLDP